MINLVVTSPLTTDVQGETVVKATVSLGSDGNCLGVVTAHYPEPKQSMQSIDQVGTFTIMAFSTQTFFMNLAQNLKSWCISINKTHSLCKICSNKLKLTFYDILNDLSTGPALLCWWRGRWYHRRPSWEETVGRPRRSADVSRRYQQQTTGVETELTRQQDSPGFSTGKI